MEPSSCSATALPRSSPARPSAWMPGLVLRPAFAFMWPGEEPSQASWVATQQPSGYGDLYDDLYGDLFRVSVDDVFGRSFRFDW